MPLTTPSVFPPASDEFVKFAGRRSVVHSTKGIVACTQPLAAKCGIQILDAGGNCVDAAVAVATRRKNMPCPRRPQHDRALLNWYWRGHILPVLRCQDKEDLGPERIGAVRRQMHAGGGAEISRDPRRPTGCHTYTHRARRLGSRGTGRLVRFRRPLRER
ncbi:hypothetical protein F4782DRAFT_386841 [Xylaria castorea]|nr:hypothetical protein F4782DRAFT_386841 [Xylaria castorea]